MKKGLLLIPVVLVLAALIVWRLTKSRDFAYAGTIEATEVDIPARLATVITAYDVKEGDPVTTGQPLVELSDDEIRLALDLAEGDYQRAQRLYKSGSMPKEAFEHLRSRWEEATLKKSWCEVKSPLTGTVMTTYHEPGEWVTPGTKLLTLADLREVWAYFYVPQPALVKFAYGQKINGVLPEMPGRVFEGRVSHISDEAEFTPKNVQTRTERTRLVYAVKVSFLNPDGYLKPGMTMEAKLPE